VTLSGSAMDRRHLVHSTGQKRKGRRKRRPENWFLSVSAFRNSGRHAALSSIRPRCLLCFPVRVRGCLTSGVSQCQ
jgi:hypothetical protein